MESQGLRAQSVFRWIALASGLAAVAALWNAQVEGGDSKPASVSNSSTSNPPQTHAVHIRRPAAPRVNTGMTNHHGEPITVACSSCHTTTRPNPDTHTSSELDQFHQGLKYQHGNLACLSCHNAKNYDTLQLATGKPIEFPDVMTLCAQCHGTAMRDYERGSHGGMTGHWDLTKGPRQRNNCVDCHDPHSPKYPQAMPVFPPRDRLAVPKETKTGGH